MERLRMEEEGLVMLNIEMVHAQSLVSLESCESKV